MQIRRLTAAAVAGLALVGLAGCRTAPNVAAYVGDNQVTVAELESAVDDRLEDPAIEQVAGEDRETYTRRVLSTLVQDHVHTVAAEKYGVEVDAGWTVVGQLNVPNKSGASQPQPIPTGNQMEDAFEQMALLMNNAFRLANAPAFPALSLTPIAIYRTAPGGG